MAVKRKLKKEVIKEIRKEKEFEQEQERLKDKYQIEKPEVVVVETSNMYKFTVNAVSSLVRLIATIILLILAAIGLMTLLYPGIRAEFLMVINDLIEQIRQFLPFL